MTAITSLARRFMTTTTTSPAIKSMEVLFLGTGSSHTLPFLECTSRPDQSCQTCLRAMQPGGEKNIRGHTSCAVKVIFEDGSSKGILIDCGMNTMPNAAKMFPKHGLKIDAVLLTHEHIDAIGGIPLLAQMRFTGAIPVYGKATTLAAVKKNFSFIFKDDRFGTISRNATLDLRELKPEVYQDICGIPVLPFPVHHGMKSATEPYISYGYLFAQNLVAIFDCHLIPETTWSLLAQHLPQPPEVFILECLALKPAPAHYGFPQAISAAARLGAPRAYFTQISHGISHEQFEKCCEAVEAGKQAEYRSEKQCDKWDENAWEYFKSKHGSNQSTNLVKLLGKDDKDDEAVVGVALQEVQDWIGKVPAVWTRPAWDGLHIDVVMQRNGQEEKQIHVGRAQNEL